VEEAFEIPVRYQTDGKGHFDMVIDLLGELGLTMCMVSGGGG
jgi:hypothetical protein